MAKMKIPKKFQWLFWSYKIDSLDLKMQIRGFREVLNFLTEIFNVKLKKEVFEKAISVN